MKLKITGISLTVECNQLEVLEEKLDKIIKKEKLIMGQLEDTLGKLVVVGEKMLNLNTAFDGLRVDIQALKDQLAALQSGEILSSVVAAKIQAISDMADALAVTVDETAAENFPPEGPVIPEV